MPDKGFNDAEDTLRDNSMHVITCLLTTPRGEEDWHESSIFYTYIKHGDKFYKVMIDGGSCVNITIKSVVEWMSIKAEPHPQPYVTRVDKTAYFVTQHCIVLIQLSSYQDRI